ncbi:hypothetical protein CONPUDRAFT_86721 [Coniophora puteana RWD-64-598 SS2]|uniref:Imidazole glycerol phosphate synthase hisHF n=1 Tax=Coniophora puteana (strain RWD-64-598) TaxID=741705 RepID=A0A5M3N5U2_CONPW|nr:uncharacterized protein CONPUDRAFT_86721 [Coniophora puteana RWD-64-598 SS2]EIW86782.1 hypothetical protein CONPUDRAFT_86721 [Coniophora puteana RWD-64-598 SS2]
MSLYILDYGAGNVQSLANSLTRLGYAFEWISTPDDFHKASSIVFPGVGAFHTAVEHLRARALWDPLRQYIQSGKPYFGICVGLQVLFQSSAESPGSIGLGIIPSPIQRFDDTSKAVPHMGWNTAQLFPSEPSSSSSSITSPSNHYYFVHSFRAPYDPEKYPEAASWAHATTQYGQEVFISVVRRGNVFGTQYHPEKSGQAGLDVLREWLDQTDVQRTAAPPTNPIPRPPQPRDGLTKRVIACMDVRSNDAGDLVVTKGDQYDVREKPNQGCPSSTALTQETAGTVRNLGKPVVLAERYAASGADELALLNITSFRRSPLHDQPMIAVVRAAAARVFVPLTIGGGITDSVDPDGTHRPALEVAGAYFRAGADKVSIGSDAVRAVERLRANSNVLDGTSAIETIARAYGNQAVVVSIDPRRAFVDPGYTGPHAGEIVRGGPGDGEDADKAWWYQCTVSGGREARDLSVVELAQGAEKLGAGELLVNSIDRDGTGRGFDHALLSLVRRAVRIPVVASSGAGSAAHFVDVFRETGVEAALAAGIFHREEVRIEDVKRALADAGISTRAS